MGSLPDSSPRTYTYSDSRAGAYTRAYARSDSYAGAYTYT
jgi:hypothetical protein